MNELELFRTEKDNFFVSHPQSPLTPEQKKEFKGLEYFPENPQLRFEVDVELFSHEGELVLDPFVGSGTTLLAAQDTNRNAVGFDLQED